MMEKFKYGDLVQIKNLGRCSVKEHVGSHVTVKFKNIELFIHEKYVTLEYSEKDKSKLYNRVYQELPYKLRAASIEYAQQQHCDSISASHGTRLTTTAIAYFSNLICGEECPDGSWANAVNTIVNECAKNQNMKSVRKDILEDLFKAIEEFTEQLANGGQLAFGNVIQLSDELQAGVRYSEMVPPFTGTPHVQG